MDFILFMHVTPGAAADEKAWDAYFERLGTAGVIRGGSRIGDGACFCKNGPAPQTTAHLDGFIRIEAPDFAAARAFLAGNPVYEAGGVVEIRELPQD
ncbi:YCII-related domain protein [Asticcacaulis biprosthecium C19]|uniref:YCII-related domain protein n=1 Tax=Asticcacaulis biprosthecium C19 TaxID=715226 RepID=F4QHB6_9CAUL|nr:YciI family protein [Asticcacaulis biprosthecium]EGF92653.1 YCII-related domain protein [Asticcacaulis biprosthecium C19]